MHADWLFVGDAGVSDRYGLAVWDGPGDSFRLVGRYSQYVIVDQERDAVLTITAHEEFRGRRLSEIAYEALAVVPTTSAT